MGNFLLKDIAEIQTGYSFRNKLTHSKSGNIYVIQMKDLDSEYVCNKNEDLFKIDSYNISDKHFVRQGDLFFKSRGKINNSSLLIDKMKAVLSAPQLLIRIKNNDKVLPEYLNWYLGQPIAQSYFNSVSEGTSQKMISRTALANFEVLVPPIEKQLLITELSNLQRKENEILKILSEKKEQYYNNVLMNIAKGD